MLNKTIELYEYQKKYIKAIQQFFLNGGLKAIICAPTGSGKTIMFSYLAMLATNKGNKVLILTDRKELQKQTAKAFKSFSLNPFLISAGAKYVTDANCYVAMVETFKRRLSEKNPFWLNWYKKNIDLLIIDECHEQTFNDILSMEESEDKHILGFTATPSHTGKMRQLGVDYEKIIECITVGELIELKKLCPAKHYTPFAPDTEKVEFDAKTGDYKRSSLYTQFNKTELYAGVVENWIDTNKGKKTICFCINKQHAINTCLEFEKHGIKAKYIVSKSSSPKKPENAEDQSAWSKYCDKLKKYEKELSTSHLTGDRDQIFEEFENGEFEVLVNVDIATKGYDCPSIECVILNMATLSLTRYLQAIGRGARICEWIGKKFFSILDFGGNIERHGRYEESRIWGLWHEESKGGGIAPIKECGHDSFGQQIKAGDDSEKVGCKMFIPASARICPHIKCGFVYPENKREGKKVKLFDHDSELGSVPIFNKRKMDTEEFVSHCIMQKYDSVKIWRELYLRGGVEEVKKAARLYKWRKPNLDAALRYCKRFRN